MRALVALLLVLNIGFAAWQLTRQEVQPARRPPADADVEPLRLLVEMAETVPAKQPVVPPVPSPPSAVSEQPLP